MLAFAEKITLRAHEVTRQDVEDLRRQGLTDSEVLDIAMTAGARSFFSKVLDAVGAEPEERYKNLEKDLRETLAVGRTFGKTRDDDGPG